MADFDEEDPLTQIGDNRTSAPSETGEASGVSNRMQLTFAGIRAILNRKVRSKPLLRLECKGCGRNTHSPDTYIDIDYLELLGHTCVVQLPGHLISFPLFFFGCVIHPVQ